MTTTPHLRTAATAFGALALLGTVAGCATTSTTTGTTSTATYKDGEYTATGHYQSPNGTETITVDLTLAKNVVTAVTVTGEPSGPDATNYQSQFENSIAVEVVGKNINDLNVSKVAGSSLTSAGFNAAVDDIKSQAAA